MQALALIAAFWIAVLGYRGKHPVRFVGALAAAAGCAHLGWGLLHWPALRAQPAAWIDLSSGYCVLFVPVGCALVAAEAAAFRSLPLALAVARSGCLVAGCCRGPQGEPAPLVEIAAWLVLHHALLRTPGEWVRPLFLASFGVVRIALGPWRADPPLGLPVLDPRWIATLWVVVGAALALRASGRGGAIRLRRQAVASSSGRV